MQTFVFIPSGIVRTLGSINRLARGYAGVATGTVLMLSVRVLLLHLGRKKYVLTFASLRNVCEGIAKSRVTIEQL